MQVISFVILIMGSFLIFSGCGKTDKGKTGDGKLNIVTTIGMITDIVENIGGERVDVIGLMGPGVDPHLYKASAGDVQKLQAADLIFYNGLHLEGAMAELLEKMAGRVKTAAVTDGIDVNLLLSPKGYAGSHDPHVWFDVTLWIKAAEKVRDALIETDPDGAEIYRNAAVKYIDNLRTLHDYVLSKAAEVPADQRVLITAHDAFHYFGQAYGFDVRGLQGISTVTEAGTADVRELAEFIAENKIPAVFIESSVSPRAIQALRAAVKDRGFEVNIGGELFSDAMGDRGTPEGTYAGMVRHNINTIVLALTGQSE
jgi:manganese/zinc/iron transport system substrate-binding protein